MFKSILSPTDFSEPSAAALNYARQLAQVFDSALHVLHVVPNLAADAYGYPSADLTATWEQNARAQLAQLLPEEDRARVQGQIATRVGNPVLEILRYADELHADLIVMGTHGRGPIEHLFMGSVAERIVRKASCPVLTVPRAAQPLAAGRAALGVV